MFFFTNLLFQFDVWLIGLLYFFSNLPAIYQLIRERQFLQQTIASQDSPFGDLHRLSGENWSSIGWGPVGVRRLHVQSGAYGSSVAVAFLCLNIRSKNLVDIAWLQLLVVETCFWLLKPYTNQTYMKCLLGFEHKDSAFDVTLWEMQRVECSNRRKEKYLWRSQFVWLFLGRPVRIRKLQRWAAKTSLLGTMYFYRSLISPTLDVFETSWGFFHCHCLDD